MQGSSSTKRFVRGAEGLFRLGIHSTPFSNTRPFGADLLFACPYKVLVTMGCISAFSHVHVACPGAFSQTLTAWGWGRLVLYVHSCTWAPDSWLCPVRCVLDLVCRLLPFWPGV